MTTFRKLKADEIEVKIKQVIKTEKWSGVAVLLYKTARTDMDILDETFGVAGWQCEYETIKDNLYCKIGIWSEKHNQWIWKQDCGIESRADGEGNEKKGEASDAFKRAGFKVGIGRELYTSPKILIQAEVITGKDGKNYLKDKYESYSVNEIQYDDKGDIASLGIEDRKGNIVFVWKKQGFNAHKEQKPTYKEVKDGDYIPY
jgi:hypothetical protein